MIKRFSNPIFGNRLKYLYELNNIDTNTRKWALSVAKSLYDKNILYYGNENKTKEMHHNDTARQLQAHLLRDTPNDTIWIKRYCDFFDCSSDFLLGYIDEPTHEKNDIYKSTGLSSQAIDCLKSLMISDENAVNCMQPSLRVLPVLNDLMSDKIFFDMLLRGINQYLNTEYYIPVYHTGNAIHRDSEKGILLDEETIISNSGKDREPEHSFTYIDNNGYRQTANFPTMYFQHFAKNADNPYDNISIPIDVNFMQSVALKQIENSLNEIRETILESRKQK